MASFADDHIVHMHGMVCHFVGIGKMFSCKGLFANSDRVT